RRAESAFSTRRAWLAIPGCWQVSLARGSMLDMAGGSDTTLAALSSPSPREVRGEGTRRAPLANPGVPHGRYLRRKAPPHRYRQGTLLLHRGRDQARIRALDQLLLRHEALHAAPGGRAADGHA